MCQLVLGRVSRRPERSTAHARFQPLSIAEPPRRQVLIAVNETERHPRRLDFDDVLVRRTRLLHRDGPDNRRRCTALLKIIKGEIALGIFDYRRHFPHGTRLPTFCPEVARSGTTVASYLSSWHARRSPFRPDGTVVELADLHPSTWKHDGSLIERRLVPALGALGLTDLRIGRCRDYRRELEAEASLGRR